MKLFGVPSPMEKAAEHLIRNAQENEQKLYRRRRKKELKQQKRRMVKDKRSRDAAAKTKKKQLFDRKVPGVPKPISTKKPSATERDTNDIINHVLKAYKLTESKEEGEAREIVLQEINDLCKDWVTQSMKRQNHAVEAKYTCLCHSFGSYRLGVHSPGADIDLLVIGPRYVTREHFFTEFVEQLRSNHRVQAILALQEAYVPLVKFKFDGVDIDMVYACVGKEHIDPKQFDIFSDDTLMHVDTKSVLSLNGARVTDTILRLVPDDDVFRKALRAIRFWAQRRGIYSNVMGYLGGVSWAILVAHICQLYPNGNEAVIVQRFFTFFDLWNFSFPIKLCTVNDNEKFSFSNWDPETNEREKFDIFPIITPVYPTMNSTHNVITATHDVLKSEFSRGRAILAQKRAKEPISQRIWMNLFKERDFFSEHKQFICIKTGSHLLDDQIVWRGFVESKLRSFAQRLNDGDSRVCAIPWPYPIVKSPDDGSSKDGEGLNGEQKHLYEHWFFVGLDIDRSALGQGQKVNLTPTVQHFHKQLNFSPVANELNVHANIRCYTRKSLPAECRLPRPRPRSIARPAVPLPSPPEEFDTNLKGEPTPRTVSPASPPGLIESSMETCSSSTSDSKDPPPRLPTPSGPPPLENGEADLPLPKQALPPGCALARVDEENRRRRKREDRKRKKKRKRDDSSRKEARRRKRRRLAKYGDGDGFEASGKLLKEEHKRKKKRRRRADKVDSTSVALSPPSTRKKRKRTRRDAVTADASPDAGPLRCKRRVVVAETVSDAPSKDKAECQGFDSDGYERLEPRSPRIQPAIVLECPDAPTSSEDATDDNGLDDKKHAPWLFVQAMAARLNMEKGRELFRTLRRHCDEPPNKRMYRDETGKWDLERLQSDIDDVALRKPRRSPVTIDLTDLVGYGDAERFETPHAETPHRAQDSADLRETPRASAHSPPTDKKKTSRLPMAPYRLGDLVTVRIATGRWSRGRIKAANGDSSYDVYFKSRKKIKHGVSAKDIRPERGR